MTAEARVPFWDNPEVWVAVGFLVFLAIAVRPAWRAIKAGLDRRIAKIRSDITEARQLREEAEARLRETRALLDRTASDAQDMLAAAHREIELAKQQAETHFAEFVAQRERNAAEKIDQAERNASGAIRDRAIRLAIAAARDILIEQANGIAGDAWLDEAIRELPNQLNESAGKV